MVNYAKQLLCRRVQKFQRAETMSIKKKAEINTLTYQMMTRIPPPTLSTVNIDSIHFEFDIQRTVHRDIFL